MKKVLKGLGIVFFGSGIVVYTVCMFEEPKLFPVFLCMDLLFGFFLFLLLRKKKPRAKAPKEPPVQVKSNLNPEAAIRSMPGAYTAAEAKNHFRILQDCLNIFEKTKNLETFFSRYEYGMQIALTLDQAAKAKIIPATTDIPATFFKAADSQKERVLVESFWDQKTKIEKLSTDRAKKSHWNRYLNKLLELEDQYAMNPDSDYAQVVEQVQNEIAKIDPSTSVPLKTLDNSGGQNG